MIIMLYCGCIFRRAWFGANSYWIVRRCVYHRIEYPETTNIIQWNPEMRDTNTC
jgi:hypothetical protein